MTSTAMICSTVISPSHCDVKLTITDCNVAGNDNHTTEISLLSSHHVPGDDVESYNGGEDASSPEVTAVGNSCSSNITSIDNNRCKSIHRYVAQDHGNTNNDNYTTLPAEPTDIIAAHLKDKSTCDQVENVDCIEINHASTSNTKSSPHNAGAITLIVGDQEKHVDSANVFMPNERRLVVVLEPGDLGIVVQRVGFCAQIVSVNGSGLGKGYGLRVGDIFHNDESPYEPILYEMVIEKIVSNNKVTASQQGYPIRFFVVQHAFIAVSPPNVTPSGSSSSRSKNVGLVVSHDLNDDDAVVDWNVEDVSPIKLDPNLLYHSGHASTISNENRNQGTVGSKKRKSKTLIKKRLHTSAGHLNIDQPLVATEHHYPGCHDENFTHYYDHLQQPNPPYGTAPSQSYPNDRNYGYEPGQDPRVPPYPTHPPRYYPHSYCWDPVNAGYYYNNSFPPYEYYGAYHPASHDYHHFDVSDQRQHDANIQSREVFDYSRSSESDRTQSRSATNNEIVHLLTAESNRAKKTRKPRSRRCVSASMLKVVDSDDQKENRKKLQLYDSAQNKDENLADVSQGEEKSHSNSRNTGSGGELSPWLKKISHDYMKTFACGGEKFNNENALRSFPSGRTKNQRTELANEDGLEKILTPLMWEPESDGSFFDHNDADGATTTSMTLAFQPLNTATVGTKKSATPSNMIGNGETIFAV